MKKKERKEMEKKRMKKKRENKKGGESERNWLTKHFPLRLPKLMTRKTDKTLY